MTSGILQQALQFEKTGKKYATHFALCKGNGIRYMIALHNGKKRLSGNISTYSNKLGLLMKLWDFLPFFILKFGRLGYFTEAKLHPEIEQQRKATGMAYWNMIVGTYDEKQKLTLQCFNKTGDAVFIKIGNQATAVEMDTEIRFLNEGRKYQSFVLPELLGNNLIDKDQLFNIQITKEFHGKKVKPVLTEDIIRIYRELSDEKIEIDGILYERSHGDFVPWNLKKFDGQYILFDWEHCGFRSQGYDLMHYVMTIEIALNGKNLEEAYDVGVKKIQQFIYDFNVDRNRILTEYRKIIKELLI